MSAKLNIIDGEIVHLRYLDNFTYSTFVNSWRDKHYIEELQRYKKIIWDYTEVPAHSLTRDEIIDFARVANYQSQKYQGFSVVLVVVNESAKSKAKLLMDYLKEIPWDVKVANCLDDAIKLLKSASLKLEN